MLDSSTFLTAFETKLVGDGATGEFEGYGAVFNTVDGHGDVIKPGAFADTLAERKAQGRSMPMHAMHGLRGDGLPVGVWKDVAEDGKGLYVKGKITGMNTDTGRLHYERVKDGAYGGLSIGYNLKPNGAIYGKAAGEPVRTLKALNLHEISLVSDPSNPAATILAVKAAMGASDSEKAAISLAAAMRMHDKVMQSNYSDQSPKDKAIMMNHLRDAHLALTGMAAPADLDVWTKALPFSSDQFVAGVKQQFGVDDEQALTMWKRLAAVTLPTDPQPDLSLKSALNEVVSLRGFSLPR